MKYLLVQDAQGNYKTINVFTNEISLKEALKSIDDLKNVQIYKAQEMYAEISVKLKDETNYR